ncbi:MAG: TonB-dependent receptor, partial [Ferruginibacter sp.]|nr:TonB-dependent receptor [Ferruginibacter sp.]
YLGANNAKAYTTGIELRLFGELVKDAESWLSISFMRSRENLGDDFYYQYKNAAGEVITASTPDQVVADSVKNNVGWLRRPTDRLITVGLYLEDYLSTNKNFKVHLNLLYGSNMSYNIPNSVRYRNGLIIDPYIRVDMGFSALLLNEKSLRRSHSPFRSFDNIWASLEVFNLINRPNTISFQLIKDFSNAVYAIPNRLTPRLLNLKLLARF